jgi:SAM-dependent methyltransferase
MDDQANKDVFYEKFWADARYQQAYAFDSAVRDRFPAIKMVWGDLRLPERVLDYGCGNGVLTYWLWSNGFGREITGVDVSRTGVDNARRDFGRPGLNFETLDAVERLVPESFDVVVSSHVLEHIDHPETALAAMAAKAEWLVLEVPLEKCLWPEFAARLRGRSREDNPLGHVNFWDKRGFNAFLKNAGLLVVRDHHYASAPFSPFNHPAKRWLERIALKLLGVPLYAALMATHYIVLARKIDV